MLGAGRFPSQVEMIWFFLIQGIGGLGLFSKLKLWCAIQHDVFSVIDFFLDAVCVLVLMSGQNGCLKIKWL
jgi:hypothetical protein